MKSTHDWSTQAEPDHVLDIQKNWEQFSRGGVTHLALEVIAYAVDEANEGTTNQIWVTLRQDGAICVADNGRGTAIHENAGNILVKPIIATRDLRFFGIAGAPILPDGLIRSGISVVGALSEWITHTNRREQGSWTQRYEYGLPTGQQLSEASNNLTGTMICFLPNEKFFGLEKISGSTLKDLCLKFENRARVTIVDER